MAAGANRPLTGNVDAPEYIEEEDEEYDEDDYETEDDGDVFAFVPPDLGPSPAVVQLDGPNVTVADANAQVGSPSHQSGIDAGMADDETFYYDEATGAVYDSQGRLVEMPVGFDPSTIRPESQSALAGDSSAQRQHSSRPLTGSTAQGGSMTGHTQSQQQHAQQHIQSHTPGVGQVNTTMPHAARPSPGHSIDFGADVGGIRSMPLQGSTSMASLDRQDSYASSMHRDMGETPMLPNARPISGFPVSMEALQESPQSRDGASQVNSIRDVGMTATGGQQLDEMGRDVNGQLRKRSNRFSHNSDTGLSPTNDLPFSMPAAPPYDEVGEDSDDKHAIDMIGGGSGMVHPQVDFQSLDVGSKRLRMVELELETEEDSPYPEVRASVSNIDDPDMPCGTVRAWFLAFLLSTLAGAVNMILTLRYPAPTLTPIVMQLVTYPCGKFLAAVLPIRTFTLPQRLGGASFSLNPGLFNIKEHTLITIVLNLTIGQAYALYAILTINSSYFYNSPKPVLFSVLLTVSTQMLGFSLAGISRRFLVWPASMIWPQNLVTTTILNTLHAEEDGHDGSMTRFKYFTFVLGGAFIWNFVPNYLFQALSTFGWICWIWPNNFVVNMVFGTQNGLGLSVLTFDWNQINYIGSPLVFPWWAECNVFAGFLLWICILVPILYFTNTLYTSFMPFNSNSAYDNKGHPYNILSIVTDRNQFDEAAYKAYSPLYLSASYLVLYITGFASSTAVLSHTVLYHGKALWRGMRHAKTEEDDIHAKFMRRYPEVPSWWYFTIGVIMFAIGIIAIEVYDTGMPIWALVVAVTISGLYFLPSGFIYAMTGTAIGTNLIGELTAGYALPGVPIANMIFKVYAFTTLSGGLNFTQDLKLGHYMKVPPRQSFAVQTIFPVWIALVQIGVQQFMMSHVNDLCSPQQAHRFTCPHARVFFTSSIVWGIIGPRRLFGDQGLYTPLYWALLVGVALPVPFWLLARKYPKSWLKFVSVPIALSCTTYVPPASGIVYTSWFTVAFIFQYLIRKYNFRWWSKYNFVTSAALDSGTIISTIAIFLMLQLPKDGSITLKWWGNTVSSNTLDANPRAWRNPPAGGFGAVPHS